LQNLSRQPSSLDRLPDIRELGYIVALFAVLPLLVLYIDGSVKMFILSVQAHWGVWIAQFVSAAGYGLVNAAIAAALMAAGLVAGRPRE